MKFLFKFILLVILFLFSLLIFLPKEGLFNLLEKELVSNNIIISNEIRNEKLLGLNISGADIYYDGINVSFVNKIDIDTFLFYNKIKVDKVRVSDSFKKIIPSKIDEIDITYSILNFNKILISSKGEFGEFEGEVQIFDRKILGELIPSKLLKSKHKKILREFKLMEGKYKYEYKF